MKGCGIIRIVHKRLIVLTHFSSFAVSVRNKYGGGIGTFLTFLSFQFVRQTLILWIDFSSFL